MKWLFALTLTCLSSAASAGSDFVTLSKVYAPLIEGDTLTFEGRIDSHLFDYLSEEAESLKDVKYLSLNSYGGNTTWAIDIAAKIQSLNITTLIKKGNVCASACVYLFAASKNRVMEKNTQLVVEGARLPGSFSMDFTKMCFKNVDNGVLKFNEKKKGCKEFLTNWYDLSLNASNTAFDIMEKAGVASEARQFYFSLPDDPKWPENLNVLKKPKWTVDTTTALQYGFATKISE